MLKVLPNPRTPYPDFLVPRREGDILNIDSPPTLVQTALSFAPAGKGAGGLGILSALLLSISISSAYSQSDTSSIPLTIDQSVAFAIHHSPQVAGARITRDSAVLSAERDRPSVRSTLNLITNATIQGPHVTFPRSDGFASTVIPEQYGKVSLVFEQPLYRSGLKQATARYTSEIALPGLEFRKDLTALVLAVKKGYIAVLRAQTGVLIASKQMEAAIQSHTLALKQIEAGTAKPVDAYTSNSLVLESKAGVLLAEEGQQLATLNFNRLLGRAFENRVVLKQFSGLPVLPVSVQAAIEKAMHMRPEILTLQNNLDAARAGLQLAKIGDSPSLGFRAEITQQTRSAFLPASYYAATLEMRWPLLDMGKTHQDTKEARAAVLRLEAALEEAKQSVDMEVRQAWVHLKTTLDRFSIIRLQMHGVEVTALVAQKAYQVGRGTFFEMQAANRQLQITSENENQARYDVWEAMIEFESAQGDDKSYLSLASVHERFK